MANLEKLKTQLEDIARKENYRPCDIDIKPITSGGANYTTNLFLATISEPLKPDIHIFVKVANLDEASRNQNVFLVNLYTVESFFYKELAVTFERLYSKNQVPDEDRLALAKYYGDDMTQYEETFFFENVAAKGFKDFDRMKTFDWEYAASAVIQLARFHALGMAIREENPAKFEKLDEKFDSFEYRETLAQFMEHGIKNGCEALSEEHKKRVLKYFPSREHLMAVASRFIEDKITLLHADFRPSNLMHRRQNGKLQIITLDFQTLRMGNPVGDIMGFIFAGSDEEFRRLHYQRLLDHYFSELTLALKNLGIDVEKVYPRKTFDTDVIKMRPIGLVLGLSMIGMLTVAPEDAPTHDGDLTTLMVKPNELAKERMTGIVNDFIRWGEL